MFDKPRSQLPRVVPHGWPVILPDDQGLRGRKHCFYCGGLPGEPHGLECVCVTRKIRVRWMVDTDIDVPHFWEVGTVLFHFNEKVNQAEELAELLDGDPPIEVVFRGDVDRTPRRSNDF